MFFLLSFKYSHPVSAYKLERDTRQVPPVTILADSACTLSEHKHLGLTISDDGNWDKHVDLITKKAFTRVNIMRTFKFILDRRTIEPQDRQQLYKDYIICK
jgi:hypothetical protein